MSDFSQHGEKCAAETHVKKNEAAYYWKGTRSSGDLPWTLKQMTSRPFVSEEYENENKLCPGTPDLLMPQDPTNLISSKSTWICIQMKAGSPVT